MGRIGIVTNLVAVLAVLTCVATPALAVTAGDDGQATPDTRDVIPCYLLSDVSIQSDGYVRLRFGTNKRYGDDHLYERRKEVRARRGCKPEIYFSETQPKGKIRGAGGISGSNAGLRFHIIVEPDTKGLFVEMAGENQRLARRSYDLEKYIAAAKRQASGWQTAWKSSERKLREAGQRDKTPPRIVLLSPDVTAQRTVFRVDTYQIFVRGRVHDDSGIGVVLVNGKRARVADDGTFAKKVRLALGTNRMKVQAEDIHGNVAERTFAVVREEFIPDDTLADIDIPPKTGMTNPEGIAVVIGIEAYQYVPAATYAYNDAEVVREYLADAFGFRKDRVKLMTEVVPHCWTGWQRS